MLIATVLDYQEVIKHLLSQVSSDTIQKVSTIHALVSRARRSRGRERLVTIACNPWPLPECWQSQSDLSCG